MRNRDRRQSGRILLAAVLLLAGFPAWAANPSGVLERNAPTVIGSRVTGQVLSLSARPGARVAAGEVMARLDASVQQARLDEASAQATDSRRQLERIKTLYDRGVIATRDLEVAQRNFDESMARLHQAQALLSYTEIRAPYAGRVVGRYVAEGETVVARLRAPRLFKIVPDGRSLRLALQAPRMPSLQVGQRLQARVAGKTYPAVLTQVQPNFSQAKTQFLVLQVLQTGHALRPGMRAELMLPEAKADNGAKATAAQSPGKP